MYLADKYTLEPLLIIFENYAIEKVPEHWKSRKK